MRSSCDLRSPDEPQLGLEHVSAGAVFAHARIDRRNLSESLQGNESSRSAPTSCPGISILQPDGPAQGAIERSHKMEFPARPMLGCVGVAPAGDFAPTSSLSGPYGGNLDYNEFGEGSTVILPVYHPGALLFMGDGHALQGDGEPTGTGIETSMAVEFSSRCGRRRAFKAARRNERTHHQRRKPARVCQLDESRAAIGDERHGELADDRIPVEPWAAHLLIGYQGPTTSSPWRDRWR